MNSKKRSQQNRIKKDPDYNNRITKAREINKSIDKKHKEDYLHDRNIFRDLTMIKVYLRNFDIQTLTDLWEKTLGTMYRISMRDISMPTKKYKLVNDLCLLLYKRVYLSMHGSVNFRNLLFPEFAETEVKENARWQSVNYGPRAGMVILHSCNSILF